jgi:hypothetical protein
LVVARGFPFVHAQHATAKESSHDLITSSIALVQHDREGCVPLGRVEFNSRWLTAFWAEACAAPRAYSSVVNSRVAAQRIVYCSITV